MLFGIRTYVLQIGSACINQITSNIVIILFTFKEVYAASIGVTALEAL